MSRAVPFVLKFYIIWFSDVEKFNFDCSIKIFFFIIFVMLLIRIQYLLKFEFDKNKEDSGHPEWNLRWSPLIFSLLGQQNVIN